VYVKHKKLYLYIYNLKKLLTNHRGTDVPDVALKKRGSLVRTKWMCSTCYVPLLLVKNKNYFKLCHNTHNTLKG